jgi:hypothetical protein
MKRAAFAVLCLSLCLQGLNARPPHAPADPSTAPAASPAGDADAFACVHIDAPIKFDVLMSAERIATRIFEVIGVDLHWSCDHSEAPPQRLIHIRVQDHTPEDYLKGALAFALPFAETGVRVTVFYDRFSVWTYQCAECAGLILGHALAHEIGHVLEREDAHSSAGLMQRRWSGHDYDAMRTGTLGFGPTDARIIQNNLALKLAGTVAASLTPEK